MTSASDANFFDLNVNQVQRLRQQWNLNTRPNPAMIGRLSLQTGLNAPIVAAWFHNERKKSKKHLLMEQQRLKNKTRQQQIAKKKRQKQEKRRRNSSSASSSASYSSDLDFSHMNGSSTSGNSNSSCSSSDWHEKGNSSNDEKEELEMNNRGGIGDNDGDEVDDDADGQGMCRTTKHTNNKSSSMFVATTISANDDESENEVMFGTLKTNDDKSSGKHFNNNKNSSRKKYYGRQSTTTSSKYYFTRDCHDVRTMFIACACILIIWGISDLIFKSKMDRKFAELQNELRAVIKATGEAKRVSKQSNEGMHIMPIHRHIEIPMLGQKYSLFDKELDLRSAQHFASFNWELRAWKEHHHDVLFISVYAKTNRTSTVPFNIKVKFEFTVFPCQYLLINSTHTQQVDFISNKPMKFTLVIPELSKKDTRHLCVSEGEPKLVNVAITVAIQEPTEEAIRFLF